MDKQFKPLLLGGQLYFIIGNFYLLTTFTLFTPPSPSLYLWVRCCLDPTCKWDQTLFVFLCLTYFASTIPFRFICVVPDSKVSFFLWLVFLLFITSVCLSFYFCFANKFICIIFLDSTCKEYYTVFIFLFLIYFTLYGNF